MEERNISLNITKAKIIDGTFLELEYTETERDGEIVTKSDLKGLFRKNIHQDLKDAFNKLRPHLAFITEIVTRGEYDTFDTEDIFTDIRFDKYKVTSISLSGEDEHSGVTITGQRKLRGNKILNLNTPFTKFEEQKGQDNYYFLDEIYLHIQGCVREVELYLQGKCAPDPQLELFEKEEKPKTKRKTSIAENRPAARA